MAEIKKGRERADFTKLTDEEIVTQIHSKQNSAAQRYLLEKYRKMVLGKAKNFFLIGAEREDVVQEGMIGLFKAIRDYRPDKKASFKVFADMCVGRQLITALKSSTRQKQLPLNTYVSINKPLYAEASDHTLLDVLAGIDVANPEEMLVDEEDFKTLELEMNKILSDLEWQVLQLYLEGKKYQEIAAEIGCHTKAVDNALTRVKHKIIDYKNESLGKISPGVLHKGLIALSAKFEQSKRKLKK